MSPRLESSTRVTSGYSLRMYVADPFERRLLALAGEVGDLRLERTDQVGGGVDDRPAELLDGVRPTA